MYFDIKKAYGDPCILKLMAEGICGLIKFEAICVAGSGLGGIPLATRVSQMGDFKLTMVRNEQKEYGTKKLIDGYVPKKKDKLFIVDDVLTSGSSIKSTAEILKPTGAEIIGAYVVYKRGGGDLGFPVYHLITPEDLR